MSHSRSALRPEENDKKAGTRPRFCKRSKSVQGNGRNLLAFGKPFESCANLIGMVNFETFFSQSNPWMGAISIAKYGDPKTQLKLLQDL